MAKITGVSQAKLFQIYVRGISQVRLFPNHQPSDTTTPQGSSNKNWGKNQTMNCYTWTIKIVHTVTYSANNKVVSNDTMSYDSHMGSPTSFPLHSDEAFGKHT